MFENFDWSQIALFSGDFADFKHYEDVINSVLAVICVICAGLAAGLTMGLLSLDVTKLEIKAMTGSSVDRADAEAILPIVKKHHLLLVTLLLFNSMANEALPVFLSALLPEWLSVLISVTLVLVFGEILPSAFFTGKAQLHTAAIMIPFVKTLTYLFWPVGFPLSLCLDWVFGVEEETSVISREELGALVFLQNSDRSRRKGRGEAIEALKIQSSPKVSSDKTPPTTKKSKSSDSLSSDSSDESDEGLSTYEINIMTGILKLAKLHVRDSMIKIKSVYMISDSTRLDIGTLERLWNCGFSRIPVFRRRDKQHIIGYLLIKSLILVSSDNKVPVETLPIRQPFFVKPGLRLLEMLSMFREGRCHMALVTHDPIGAMKCMAEGKRPSSERCSVIGIVTLEDVIEEIIQGEITDETDAMPSVFPMGIRSITGGKSAMGLLSMGRSSMMQKNALNASKPVTKIDEEKKLVKRSVTYANNYCGMQSHSVQNKTSAKDRPNSDEVARGEKWLQRSTVHQNVPRYDEKGALFRNGTDVASYSAVDCDNDDDDDEDVDIEMGRNLGLQLPTNHFHRLENENVKFYSTGTKSSEENDDNCSGKMIPECDSYQSGASGYRIIRGSSHLHMVEGPVETTDADADADADGAYKEIKGEEEKHIKYTNGTSNSSNSSGSSGRDSREI